MVDSLLGFKTHKISLRSVKLWRCVNLLLSIIPRFRSPTPPVQEYFHCVLMDFCEYGNYDSAMKKLLDCPWLTETLTEKSQQQATAQKEHILRYLKGLRMDSGFKIEACHRSEWRNLKPCFYPTLHFRYSLEGQVGGKVVSTKSWRKGDKITALDGLPYLPKHPNPPSNAFQDPPSIIAFNLSF